MDFNNRQKELALTQNKIISEKIDYWIRNYRPPFDSDDPDLNKETFAKNLNKIRHDLCEVKSECSMTPIENTSIVEIRANHYSYYTDLLLDLSEFDGINELKLCLLFKSVILSPVCDLKDLDYLFQASCLW